MATVLKIKYWNDKILNEKEPPQDLAFAITMDYVWPILGAVFETSSVRNVTVFQMFRTLIKEFTLLSLFGLNTKLMTNSSRTHWTILHLA